MIIREYLKERDSIGLGLFKFFLSATSGASLFFNSACGENILLMFPYADLIVCYCNNFEEAIKIRNKMGNYNTLNIYIIVGKPRNLPFRSESFDNVSYLGILFDSDRDDPTDLSYSEIVRTLKVKSQCYLGFENAKIKNFRAKTFNSKLCLLSFSKKIRQNNLIIKSLIYFYPNLSKIHFIKEIKLDNLLKFFVSFFDFLKIFLMYDNFGFILEKKSIQKINIESSFLEEIRTQIKNKSILKLQQPNLVRLGSGGSVVVDYGPLILRMPQIYIGRKRCINNFNILLKLKEIEIPVSVPKPVIDGCYKQQYFYAETKIDGVSLDLNNPSEMIQELIYLEAKKILTSEAIKFSKMDQEYFYLLVQSEIENLIEFIEPSDIFIFKNLLNKMEKVFIDDQLPLVIHHGDFKFSNFLYNQKTKKIQGIIDWDLARIPGLPLYDMLTVVFYRRKTIREATFLDYLSRFSRKLEVDKDIDDYIRKIGISNGCIDFLSIMMMIKYINDHYYNTRTKNTKEWYERVIKKKLITPCLNILERRNLENIF